MTQILTREVSLRATLQPLTGDTIQKPSPLTGRITQITRHWPRGCRSLVGVAVGRGSGNSTWILPYDVGQYVALDNATPVVSCDEPIGAGEQLWMIVRNGDGVNPHTISVTFIVQGE